MNQFDTALAGLITPSLSDDKRVVHVVHFDYLRKISPAYPRAQILVETLRSHNWCVIVWCRNLGRRLPHQGGVGEYIIPVTDPIWRANEIVGNITGRFASKGVNNANHVSPSRPISGSAPWLLKLKKRILVHLNLMLFPDVESLWSRAVAKKLIPIVRGGDLVVTFSRPESVGLIGERAHAKGAKWWFDFADGWIFEGIRHAAFPLSSNRLVREKKLQQKWLGKADGVSTVNHILAQSFSRMRVRPDVHLYRHSVPRELVEHHGKHLSFSHEPCPLKVLYFGRLRSGIATHTLTPLLRTLSTWNPGDQKPAFWFCGGFNAEDMEDIRKIRQAGFEAEVHDPLLRSDLPEFIMQKRINAMLVLNPPHNSASTSKIYDAIALGLPIWCYAPEYADSTRLTRLTESGFAIDPIGPQPDLREVVGKLIADSRKLIPIPEECFSSRQSKAMYDCLDELMKQKTV